MQFRTKARAVDLLGKGQIADLPTAITELWKNGYDAYADNLRADLYKEGYNGLKTSYFMLSDDGKGMSSSDILDRWLVLGTDSKSRANLDIESEDTLWKRPRIKAGEKGIGRLSVAYLGNPMLMLTKKLGYSLEALFFDWRLLENYNLFLDDIQIPIRPVENVGQLKIAFDQLKEAFLSNFDKQSDADGKPIWEGKQLELKTDIISEIKGAELEDDILKKVLSFFNNEDAHGTLFLVFNPIPQIIDLSDKDEDKLDEGNFVTSSLTAFTNPFKETSISINTNFYIHKETETYDLLQSRGEFFNHSDFESADVYIKGEFDGNGTFKGKIRIFDKTIDYTYNNPRKKDKRSVYGMIPIELGYSQGEERSTNLSEVQFSKITNKVKEYGGLYVFRDDFRVLPYGRENADFLNFEHRRSKRAGTYYFSYRRMFGYLDLTRERNTDLKDKSSREGLINNSQYRAFSSDAINFFIVLAQDYFATVPKLPLFRDKVKQLNDQNLALKADRVREKAEKISFTRALNSYPKQLDEYKAKYQNLLNLLRRKLDDINLSYSEVEEFLSDIQRMDIEFRNLIPRIPKRYSPTETQKERLYVFENRLNDFIELIAPQREELNRKAQQKLEVRDLAIDFTKRYNGYVSSLERLLNEHKQTLSDKVNGLLHDYNERSGRILNALTENKEQIIAGIVTREQVIQAAAEIEKTFDSLVDEVEKTLIPLVDHIKRLSFDIDEELIQGAYKAQYDQMKYQWEQTRDTAQLGIAVEIIDHEFNQLYAKINVQLEVLGAIDSVKTIKEFGFLERNFKQLEDKYALLSPLYRISGALIKDISCNAIYSYLLDFFENQISQYDITFDVTDSFKSHNIKIKEPIIYTVFINIINNAIYWMRNKETRIIRLDYISKTGEIVIANSGEQIPDYRLERIFELFYSQRPSGRGIGLYLSKQSLNDAGLDLYASNDLTYNSLDGACFVINQITTENV